MERIPDEDLPEWARKQLTVTNRYDHIEPKPFEVGGKQIVPEEWRSIQQLDKYLLQLIADEPFYSKISQHTVKVLSRSIPTMCVCHFDGMYHMIVNPDFVEKLESYKDSDGNFVPRKDDIMSVIQHELNHIFLGHCDRRVLGSKTSSKDDARAWAIDMANNSLLVHDQKKSLPGCPIVPGLRPGMPFNPSRDPISPMRQISLALEPNGLEQAMMNAPRLESCEFYYAMLQPFVKDVSGYDGDVGTDEHGDWMTSESSPERMEEQRKDILREAANHAKNRGWGSISVEMQTRIRSYLDTQISWQEELAQWLGVNAVPALRGSTFKKLNRKFPYAQPGKRRMHGLHVAICIDMSGSVSDRMLSILCGELPELCQIAKMTIIPFDSQVLKSKIIYLEPGDQPKIDRVMCGGTDFNAPTSFVNEEAHRDMFDVMIILTDGECGHPEPSRVPRCWLIPPDCKLHFETDEKIISLKDLEKKPEEKKLSLGH